MTPDEITAAPKMKEVKNVRVSGQLRELHLFAGAGGGLLGGMLLGHTCVCAVEIEPYCRKVLLQRQRDGMLPRFPIWDEVRTFDGNPWRGLVDVVCGGFPCTDISVAGKGAGIDGKHSGLWAEMARIIGEVRPRFAFVENSPALVSRGLGRVLGDLAALGYDARWGVLGACDAGAPHIRERIWILAHADRNRTVQQRRDCDYRQRDAAPPIQERANVIAGLDATGEDGGTGLADADSDNGFGRGGALQMGRIIAGETENNGYTRRIEWPVEPDVGRVAHELADRLD